MNDRYTRVTAPASFDGQGTRRDYYFKTRNAAREFRLRVKRWKAEQKSPADTLSFADSDKRWLAYLRAHVGNLELLPAIVTHWERTAKPITRPLKVEDLCKAFVLYRQGKGLDKATLSEDRYICKRLQKHLGGYMAHELGIAEIRSFLDTAKTSDSLEHKLYKVGSLIFAYGREQRALDQRMPRHRPFLHPRFPANIRSLGEFRAANQCDKESIDFLHILHRKLATKPRKHDVYAITFGVIQWSILLWRRHIKTLTNSTPLRLRITLRYFLGLDCKIQLHH